MKPRPPLPSDGRVQPDPELPEFDPGLRRFWLLALAVLILGAVAFLAGRPAYRWVRTERARRLVEETVPAVEAGRWDEVQRAAAVAAGLAPNEPRVRWLMARLYSAGNLAEGLDLWDRLPPGSLTADDRLAWAGLALAKDRLDVATRLLNDLMTETPDAPPVLHLAMITAERQGDVPLALRLAARWLERHPGDLDAQWQLGRRLRVVADPGLRAKGRQMLLELTGNPGDLLAASWKEARISRRSGVATPSRQRLPAGPSRPQWWTPRALQPHPRRTGAPAKTSPGSRCCC